MKGETEYTKLIDWSHVTKLDGRIANPPYDRATKNWISGRLHFDAAFRTGENERMDNRCLLVIVEKRTYLRFRCAR